VQGKALGTALLLLLCLLGGCGGGGGEQSSTSPEGAAPSASGTSPAQAKSPQDAEEAAAKLKAGAEQIKRRREGSRPEESRGAPSPAEKEGGGEGRAKLPPARPANSHHDSGGGTAPFATKTGDNSIQESGTEGSPSETQAAAAVLHAYLDARVAHRWADACFYLSAGYAATIEAFAERYAKDKGVKSCAEVLEGLATGSSQQALVATAKADVGALRIEGDHGFVLYRGAGGEPFAMPMVREGGAWKVGSLEGAPLG
jgi:hypothetical protein